MAKFEKQQIKKLWERVQADQNNIENLKRINVKRSDISFNKKTREIILLSDRFVQSPYSDEALVVYHYFQNMKEWMIPFSHVFAYVHTTSAFEVNNRFVFTSNYFWKQAPHGYDFLLTFFGSLRNLLNGPPPSGGGGGLILGSLQTQLVDCPLYITVKIAVLNENVWQEVQQLKD